MHVFCKMEKDKYERGKRHMREEFGFDMAEKRQGKRWVLICSRFLWAAMIGVSVFLASRSL